MPRYASKSSIHQPEDELKRQPRRANAASFNARRATRLYYLTSRQFATFPIAQRASFRDDLELYTSGEFYLKYKD